MGSAIWQPIVDYLTALNAPVFHKAPTLGFLVDKVENAPLDILYALTGGPPTHDGPRLSLSGRPVSSSRPVAPAIDTMLSPCLEGAFLYQYMTAVVADLVE